MRSKMVARDLLAGMVAGTICCTGAAAHAASVPSYIAKAVADPTRPEVQRVRDPNRLPAEVIAFAGVKPGDKVGEIFPAAGYFTQLFCRVVGAEGSIHTVSFLPARPLAAPGSTPPAGPQAGAAPPPSAAPRPAPPPPLPTSCNVKAQTMAASEFAFPPGLDLVWTSENTHDFHTAISGKPDMKKFNQAVFDSLKPGGIYLVEDYRAQTGSGARDVETLHRIDPELVKQEVLAVGFVLVGESNLLRNPADPLTVDARENPRTGSLRTNEAENLHGKTDRFILKFRKPKR